MPNNIFNIIEIKNMGNISLKSIQNVFLNGKKLVDFNKVVPVPETINDLYDDGPFSNWHDWAIINWGISSNAYNQPENGFKSNCKKFHFTTAWKHPEKIIKLISEKLPMVTFKIAFADLDDWGNNCGEYIIKNKEIINRFGD